MADPEIADLAGENVDLSNVPQEDDRCLLRLTDFLKDFPNIPLNIEIKESFNRKINDTDRKCLKDHLGAFNDILVGGAGSRPMVVVSASNHIIREFRKCNGERFPTGLSTQEQLLLLLPLPGLSMRNRALETSYSPLISNQAMVERIREASGSTFVFLAEFGAWLPAIDKSIPSDEAIMEILDRGVEVS